MASALVGSRFDAYTKAQFLRGEIPAVGTRSVSQSSTAGIGTKEYIVVKFTASRTHLNGELITIDADGVATLGTTTAHGSLVSGGRVGIIAIHPIATTAATATMVGTSFVWAQIYGKGAVQTATISVANAQLAIGANGLAVLAAVGSASAQLSGIVGAATSGAAGLLPVLLQYPQFQGTPA